jgi:NAD(P)-dependent dehydrogenase (short-subunit alcohol dehydrogenase family)
MGPLDGKRIIVLGGSGFIGRSLCEQIAAHGGTPIAADFSTPARRRTLRAAPPSALPVDITSKKSLQGLLRAAEAAHGPIDGMVNCAYPKNARYGRKLEEVEYADFCENLSLHLGGFFLASQIFAAYFASTGRGSIVNFSSVYGVVAPRFEIYEGTSMTMPVEYAAIKAGVTHLTRYFTKYYKGKGVRFNCVSPGGVLDKQPKKFLGQYRKFACNKGMLAREDLAGAVVFLLSDASQYVNGQNLIVDDGWSL